MGATGRKRRGHIFRRKRACRDPSRKKVGTECERGHADDRFGPEVCEYGPVSKRQIVNAQGRFGMLVKSGFPDSRPRRMVRLRPLGMTSLLSYELWAALMSCGGRTALLRGMRSMDRQL